MSESRQNGQLVRLDGVRKSFGENAVLDGI